MLGIEPINSDIVLFTSEAALVNASLLKVEDSFILIDTMVRPMDGKDILEYLKSHNIRLKYIVNTHWHSDHCFGNRILKTNDTRVLSHKDHFNTLYHERNMFKPDRNVDHEKHLIPAPDKLFDKVCYWYKGSFECDAIFSGQSPCRVIHAPGHSMDMSYVYLPQSKILIAGDNVLSNNGDSLALPYFWWGDCNSLIQSLKLILDLNPDLIIPGHGKPVSLDKVKRDIKYLEYMSSESNHIIYGNPEMSTEQLLQKLINSLPVEDIYPEANPQRIWVPIVHELNLKRLILNRRDAMQSSN